jgi:hypothetical protein
MSFGINEVDFALKRIYPRFPPKNIASWKHPSVANMRREEDWVGQELFKDWLEYGNPQAVGGDFAKAQSVSSSSIGIAFDVAKVWKYGFATITNKAIQACKDDRGALFRAVKHEMDNGIRSFGDRLATEIVCGDGTGVLGIVSALPGGNQVTLTKKWHARRFKQTMVVEASTAATIATLRAGSMIVTKVNYAGGYFICGGGLIGGLAPNDYLAAYGDTQTGLTGRAAWIPLTEPGAADSFYGVNRSANPTLLAGHRLDSTAASNSIMENAEDLAATMMTTGASPDEGYLSPMNWNRLKKDLGATVRRTDSPTGRFGLKYIEQDLPGGDIKWFADPDMEDDRADMITAETWYLKSGGMMPAIDDADGMTVQRVYNAAAVQARLHSNGNVVCNAPGLNGVFPITPPA